jgi:hypothetical protein
MDERRRSPRRAVEGELATVPAVLNVRVLDISVAGVLLQSTQAVESGVRGSLRLNLGGTPFRADVEVQRIAAGDAAASSYRFGAIFVGLTPELRHRIERFMTQ